MKFSIETKDDRANEIPFFLRGKKKGEAFSSSFEIIILSSILITRFYDTKNFPPFTFSIPTSINFNTLILIYIGKRNQTSPFTTSISRKIFSSVTPTLSSLKFDRKTILRRISHNDIICSTISSNVSIPVTSSYVTIPLEEERGEENLLLYSFNAHSTKRGINGYCVMEGRTAVRADAVRSRKGKRL